MQPVKRKNLPTMIILGTNLEDTPRMFGERRKLKKYSIHLGKRNNLRRGKINKLSKKLLLVLIWGKNLKKVKKDF